MSRTHRNKPRCVFWSRRCGASRLSSARWNSAQVLRCITPPGARGAHARIASPPTCCRRTCARCSAGSLANRALMTGPRLLAKCCVWRAWPQPPTGNWPSATLCCAAARRACCNADARRKIRWANTAGGRYGCVATFFCADSATHTLVEWRHCVRHIPWFAGARRPADHGGPARTCRGCGAARFVAACRAGIVERQVRRALDCAGFDAMGRVLEVAELPDQRANGFDVDSAGFGPNTPSFTLSAYPDSLLRCLTLLTALCTYVRRSRPRSTRVSGTGGLSWRCGKINLAGSRAGRNPPRRRPRRHPSWPPSVSRPHARPRRRIARMHR